jgi:hypothetical protein
MCGRIAFVQEAGMAEEKKGEGQASSSSSGGSSSAEADQQTGDPGRTPGTAEGDRETVEKDLEDKQGSRD